MRTVLRILVLSLSSLLTAGCGPDWNATGSDAGSGSAATDPSAATRDSGGKGVDTDLPELDDGGTATDEGANTDAGSTGQEALCPGAAQVIRVAADGSGNHTTIQAAVNAVSPINTKSVQISIKAGTYNEHVDITKSHICLIGESAQSTAISATAGTNIGTGGTVIVTGADFSAANITFRNGAAVGSGQAVALMAKGSRQQFINCRFVSYQDALYVNAGTQYFKGCYIQGNTDYIFGEATAVFDGCTMNNVSEGTAVTAPRTSPWVPSYSQ